MKKKILKITTIMIMFTLVYVSIVNALSFTATITPSSTTVAESTEFTVKIKVSNLDVGTNGINSLSGYLKYDKDVFETITDSSIDGLNGWSPAYSADSEKVTVTKPTFVKSEEEVFQVTLKTKTGVSGKTGKIEFTNIVASNTDAEIQAQNVSTEITVGTVSENVLNTTGNNTIGLSNVINNTAKYLENDRYLGIVIGDIYKNSEVVPLAFLCMDIIKRNFKVKLKGILVKNIEGNRGKLGSGGIWHYRALKSDYYIFKHEYVMVFQKR